MFKTIEKGNRGIDCSNLTPEIKNVLNTRANKLGFILDFENDLIIHPVLGAFISNYPIKKNKEPQEELLNDFSEFISNGCHLVLGVPYYATISESGNYNLYGVYCTNYKDFLEKTKSKVKTK